MKYRRNEPCFCGSGNRFKKCHGSYDYTKDVLDAFRKMKMGEKLREQQQGLGRPIIAAEFAGQRMVAVRNTLHWSDKWKTFADFLMYYLLISFGREWFESEKLKQDKKHLLLEWVKQLDAHKQQSDEVLGGIVSSEYNGLIASVVGLAYNLYLIDHNVELQERLLQRLRNIDDFQGALYELTIASILIRSGFKLALEDESKGETRHCEFSAIAPSGQKFWVEAKSRAVEGILGKTSRNGCKATEPATSKLANHLNGALSKPAADQRLIFIDLNAPFSADNIKGEIKELEGIVASVIGRCERGPGANKSAYVFVTSFSCYRFLLERPMAFVASFGLNIPDFNKPGVYTLREMYAREMKHQDAFNIAKAFTNAFRLPSTFDGSPPSQTYERNERIVIGETYDFGDTVPGGVGRVTSVSVSESERLLYLSVADRHGGHSLITQPMTNGAMEDYAIHGNVLYGEVDNRSFQSEDPFELFKWFLQCHRAHSRERLIELMQVDEIGGIPISSYQTHELLELYCEDLVRILMTRKDERAASTPSTSI